MLQNTSRHKSRIEEIFSERKAKGEGCLVAYLTGGDPNPQAFLSNAMALVEGGADVLEIGIPFSDPIADGPVIQASSQRALDGGMTPRRVLDLAKKLSGMANVPLAILSYYNPILAMGTSSFMKVAKQSGIDGVVVPDLPIEASGEYQGIADKFGIDTIFLAAPNTSEGRLRKIIETTRGFLYLVSLYGVTGPREKLSPQAIAAVKNCKSLARNKIPVAAGFGVSSPDHVQVLVRSGADGAVVGSLLVRIVADRLDDPEGAIEVLRDKTRELKKATRATN